jgi:chromosome segregation ATPase
MSDTLTPERIAYGRKLLARLAGYVGSRLVQRNGSWHEVLYEELEPHETYEADIKEWMFANRTALLKAADENATLRAEVEQAKRMNAELRKDVRTRDSHIADLETEIATLRTENAKLRRWLDDAEAELERLRKAVAMGGKTL